ncbi:hypothetical protein HanIR_Chr06g0264791 [Helianthus annuus]|nr:hypothetical protein HanIR_Chr06g0264791 [Helianthus annuus]
MIHRNHNLRNSTASFCFRRRFRLDAPNLRRSRSPSTAHHHSGHHHLQPPLTPPPPPLRPPPSATAPNATSTTANPHSPSFLNTSTITVGFNGQRYTERREREHEKERADSFVFINLFIFLQTSP